MHQTKGCCPPFHVKMFNSKYCIRGPLFVELLQDRGSAVCVQWGEGQKGRVERLLNKLTVGQALHCREHPVGQVVLILGHEHDTIPADMGAVVHDVLGVNEARIKEVV